MGPVNVLQVVAWTGMLVDHSRDNAVGEAIEMTFSGDNPCNLCCAIQEAKVKEQEQPLAPTKPDGREQLRHDLFPSSDVTAQEGRVCQTLSGPRAGPRNVVFREFLDAVPTPPPRA